MDFSRDILIVIDMTEAEQHQSSNNALNVKIPPPITMNFPLGTRFPTRSIIPQVPGTINTKKKLDSPVDGEKLIFVRCDRCEKTLRVKIPRKLILENEEEIVPISIVHGANGNRHVLTVYLAPDFRSRRDKVSDVIFVED